MTKNEFENAVAAYLDSNNEELGDVIENLTKTIKDYYERADLAAKRQRAAAIDVARSQVCLAVTDYFKAFYGDMSDEMYDSIFEDVEKGIKEVEPNLEILVKLTKKNNACTKAADKKTESDDKILRDFFNSLF